MTARSLVARNSAAVPYHRRGLTAKEKILSLNRDKWLAAGQAYARQRNPVTGKPNGDDRGRALAQSLMWSEQDYRYGCLFLFGVDPFRWQQHVHDHQPERRLRISRLPNGGGKTTGYALDELYDGFFRKGASPLWGQYRLFHFAPQEAQALETKIKIDEILAGRAREQMYEDRATGETKIRKCFAARWIKPAMFAQHHGYTFFNGGSTLEFVPTAFRGMGKDGTDPMRIYLDEGRHEQHLMQLVTKIWIPRFLRTPGSRLDIRYTPFDASPELEMLLDFAASSRNWFVFIADQDLRTLNPTITKENESLVRETLEGLAPEAIDMVLHGKAIQPAGAKFALGAVRAMFTTPSEPPGLGKLEGLRARVTGRCKECKRQNPLHEHMMVGALDPASSAESGDAIAFIAWDLEAPFGGIECVYIYEVRRTGAPDGPETIQKVAEHFVRVGREIQGPMGLDRKSALGHAVKDQIVRLAQEEVELVEVAWDTREEKDADLDKVKALIEGGRLKMPFHRKSKVQFTIYTREDRKIAQDFVMVQAVAAHVAWPFLPDFITTPEERATAERAGANPSEYDGGEMWTGDLEGIGVGPSAYGGPDEIVNDLAETIAPTQPAAVSGIGPQRRFARGA